MEIGCQIYLVAGAEQLDALAEVLAAAPVAALRGPVEAAGLAHGAGAAFVLAGTVKDALAAGADGAHLPDDADIPAARRAAGDMQIGLSCGTSRDMAMTAGENGADYVGFEAAEGADLIAWWAEVMELPVVAEGVSSPEQAAALARAGADFVEPAYIWTAPEGPAEAIRALAAAIAEPAP